MVYGNQMKTSKSGHIKDHHSQRQPLIHKDVPIRLSEGDIPSSALKNQLNQGKGNVIPISK